LKIAKKISKSYKKKSKKKYSTCYQNIKKSVEKVLNEFAFYNKKLAENENTFQIELKNSDPVYKHRNFKLIYKTKEQKKYDQRHSYYFFSKSKLKCEYIIGTFISRGASDRFQTLYKNKIDKIQKKYNENYRISKTNIGRKDIIKKGLGNFETKKYTVSRTKVSFKRNNSLPR